MCTYCVRPLRYNDCVVIPARYHVPHRLPISLEAEHSSLFFFLLTGISALVPQEKVLFLAMNKSLIDQASLFGQDNLILTSFFLVFLSTSTSSRSLNTVRIKEQPSRPNKHGHSDAYVIVILEICVSQTLAASETWCSIEVKPY